MYLYLTTSFQLQLNCYHPNLGQTHLSPCDCSDLLPSLYYPREKPTHDLDHGTLLGQHSSYKTGMSSSDRLLCSDICNENIPSYYHQNGPLLKWLSHPEESEKNWSDISAVKKPATLCILIAN